LSSSCFYLFHKLDSYKFFYPSSYSFASLRFNLRFSPTTFVYHGFTNYSYVVARPSDATNAGTIEY
jgi:hypothetical protein